MQSAFEATVIDSFGEEIMQGAVVDALEMVKDGTVAQLPPLLLHD
jgi:hypothetical protein